MRRNFLFTILLGLIAFSCEEKEEIINYDLVIHNANIVDVLSEEVEMGQSIFISGDSIVRVEKVGEGEKFAAAEVVDAKGGYIIPGLWDMHVHFRGGDSLIEENKNFLPLFLAYGITTVRDAGGDITPAVLKWREQVKKGELVGPDIFTPGPKLDGPDPAWPGSIPVTNPEEISKALDSLQALGVDYVKIYDGSLSKEAFYNIIEAADAQGLKTTGHMPLSASFMEAIDRGLDGSEHMYYPLKACSPVADSLTELNLGYGMISEIIKTYDPELAEEVFEKMSRENVSVTPTLHITKVLSGLADVDHSKDSLLVYMGSGIQETYKGRIEGAKRAKASGNTMRNEMQRISAEMIKPMYEAGVNILAGSDSGAFNSFVYPGESLHGELKSLVEAGLTPAQALETSIINGPEFFGLQEKYGSIGPGKFADILILKQNPLENLENLKQVVAVVKSGKLISTNEINKMLEEVKQKTP